MYVQQKIIAAIGAGLIGFHENICPPSCLFKNYIVRLLYNITLMAATKGRKAKKKGEKIKTEYVYISGNEKKAAIELHGTLTAAIRTAIPKQ